MLFSLAKLALDKLALTKFALAKLALAKLALAKLALTKLALAKLALELSSLSPAHFLRLLLLLPSRSLIFSHSILFSKKVKKKLRCPPNKNFGWKLYFHISRLAIKLTERET